MARAENTRWEVAISDDGSRGYLEAVDELLPAHADVIVGVFVVAVRREFDMLFDPNRLRLSATPKPFRLDGQREAMVPTNGRKAEVWYWVITGLGDAER